MKYITFFCLLLFPLILTAEDHENNDDYSYEESYEQGDLDIEPNDQDQNKTEDELDVESADEDIDYSEYD